MSSQRELLTSVLQANLSLVSVSQNEVVKRISAVCGIVAVPTFIASVYGMNFDTHARAALALRLSPMRSALMAALRGARLVQLLQDASTGSNLSLDDVFPSRHVGGPVFEPLQVAALTLVGDGLFAVPQR